MQIILQGPSITSNKGKNQAALSLAQLASFNVVKTEGKRSRANTSTTNKHSKNREPPVPVYVGLTIQAQTRKKELVERMHSLGLSISYNRVLEISSELAGKACRQFQHDRVVCPMKLRHGLFTTDAVDNIDHNPSSTTSKDSFHGTAISLFQHHTEHCKGTERMLSPELEVETISKTFCITFCRLSFKTHRQLLMNIFSLFGLQFMPDKLVHLSLISRRTQAEHQGDSSEDSFRAGGDNRKTA